MRVEELGLIVPSELPANHLKHHNAHVFRAISVVQAGELVELLLSY